MEHLNYCRQVNKQFLEIIAEESSRGFLPGKPKFDTGQYGATCRAIEDAEKFLLPDGGTLWSEKTFATMDDSVVLKLPSKVIAIEFSNTVSSVITKCLCIAFEDTIEKTIWVRLVLWHSQHKRWQVHAPVCFPNVNYFQGQDLDEQGNRIVKLHVDDFNLQPAHKMGAWTLLSFLNALQCSNVCTELSLAKYNAKVDTPFHDYKILKLENGGVNSRRVVTSEFRGGTVVRIVYGKIWVNDVMEAAK